MSRPVQGLQQTAIGSGANASVDFDAEEDEYIEGAEFECLAEEENDDDENEDKESIGKEKSKILNT